MDISDHAVNIAIVAFGLMLVVMVLLSVLNVIDFFTGCVNGKPFQSFHKRWDLDEPEPSSMNSTSEDSGKIPDLFDYFHPLHDFYWGDRDD